MLTCLPLRTSNTKAAISFGSSPVCLLARIVMSQFVSEDSEARTCIAFAFLGLVLDIMWCVFKLVGNLLTSVQSFRRSLRAAKDYLNAQRDENSYICLEKVCPLDFLDPGYGRSVRTLQIGEEVRTSHSTRCLVYGKPWWGAQLWPGAVKLIDGSWIDLRQLPAGTAFPLAKLHQSEPDGGQYIVCKQQLDVQESCSLNSPVVRVLQRGEIIPAPRRIATQWI